MPYTPTFLSIMKERELLLSQIYRHFGQQYPGFSSLWSSFEEHAIEEVEMLTRLEEKQSLGTITYSIIHPEQLESLATFVEQLGTFSQSLFQAPGTFSFQKAVEITAYFEHFSFKHYNVDLEYVDEKHETQSCMKLLHYGFHDHASRLKELIEASQIDIQHAETLTMTELLNVAKASQTTTALTLEELRIENERLRQEIETLKKAISIVSESY